MAAARPQTGLCSNSSLSRSFSVHALASLLIILALFVQSSWQQKDPLNDFCRRFGQQSAVIDDKLYLDGGIVNWNPLSQNPGNYSNTFLLYNDLTAVSKEGEPPLYGNLSKNGTIPSVVGGVLWSDNVNKRFFLFGGEYYQTPASNYKLLSYDAINNQWDSYGVPSTPLTSVAWGAGISISERGEGYYYGGWVSNTTTPGYIGDPAATDNLIRYNMDTNVWTRSAGPDIIPRAEGVMVYLPASDRGLLIYFGGITQPYNNATIVGSPMSTIYIYDIASSRWYTQTASGDVPEMRRRFCAGATWAQDQSSYNIYLYGGAGMAPNTTGFDDVYILSLPSFTWIKWYPSSPGLGNPHNSLTCNVINGAQMIIIGGTFPTTDQCDAPNVWGTHSLDLGKQNPDRAMWYAYRSNITSYVVPDEILSKVGGDGLGGATVTAPATWSNRDLPVFFTRKASVAARTATRAVTTATATSTSTSSTTSMPPSSASPMLSAGAVAGIAVGGAAVLILLFALGCFCIRRRGRSDSSQAMTDTAMPSHDPRMYYYQDPSPAHPTPAHISPVPAEVEDTSYNQHGVHHISMEPKYDPAMRHYRNGSMPGQNSQDGIWSQHNRSPSGSPHPSQQSLHPSQQSPRFTTLSPAGSEPAELGAGRPPMPMNPSYGSNGQRPWTPGREGPHHPQYV